MAYKFRVILDVEADVFRDILVDENIHLEALHFIIARSFGFKGQEMASFIKTNDAWEQKEEIPLFDISEDNTAVVMKNYVVKDVFNKSGDKLIYVYDFLSLWSFFVELTKIVEDPQETLPTTTLTFGLEPDEAPKKEFKSEFQMGDFDDEPDEQQFENIDDLDLDTL